MANINKIRLSGQTYNIEDANASKTVELTQAQYDALTVKDPNTFYIITDSQGADLSNYYTKSETSGATEISTALNAKQDTLVSGTNIKTINNESILGSGNIEIQGGGGTSYSAGDGIDITNDVISVTGKADTSAVTAIQDSLSGYVTTDTLQDITVQKTFVGDPTNKKKSIKFKQYDNASKVGFVIVNSAETNNELASFEFRPNTFTIDGIQHPLLYFGHYRNTNIANAGVPQTVIGFRQYDQANSAAYHYLIPLPEKAKTPFNLTTSFKDYYAPMGFKNGSTMITADSTGVVDLSSEFGGKVDTSTYNTYTAATATAINSKASQSDLSTLSGTVTAHTANTDIHVTTAQTAAWNAKSDFSGSYNDLTDKPTIPTVPTSNTAFTNDAGYITIDAISGKVDPSTYNTYTAATDTALASKQTTLTAGTGIDITDNVISATGGGGGGKAVSGGTNISITTGETADTINCTLPITISDSANGSKQSIAIGSGSSAHISNWYDSIAIGKNSKGYFGSVVIGSNPTAYSTSNGANVAIGNETKFYNNSIIIGNFAQGYNGYNANSIAIGVSARANNIQGAVAIGYNAYTNGTTKTNINNQLKIDTSNQVYISNSANTSTYCLQEKIENTESALGGLKLVKLTQSEYDALSTKDSNTLYVIVN